mmetsp:Transcript_1464/g.4744  ORF Transcript_1464/g.4744 Transcript_1464/m.4744 type:complete len:346 (+) Transcript_1464:2458-3495(+)
MQVSEGVDKFTRMSAGVPNFPCSECDKVFKCRGKLNQHMRVHTNERPFRCSVPGCEKTFARSDNLKRHTMSHRPESERPLACRFEGCEKRFVTNQKRNRHELLHKQSRPFVCSICDQAFTKKNLLKAHTTEHTGLAPYQCPVDSCTKRFRYPQELRRHQERRHPSSPRYTCERNGCQEKFYTFSEMRKHRKLAHKQELLSCSSCSRKFVHRSRLQEHEKTHEVHAADRVRYPCNVCGKNLSSASNLKTHIRTVHQKKASYSCSVCGKNFRLKQTMQRHEKIVHKSLPQEISDTTTQSQATTNFSVDEMIDDDYMEDEIALIMSENALDEDKNDYYSAIAGRLPVE